MFPICQSVTEKPWPTLLLQSGSARTKNPSAFLSAAASSRLCHQLGDDCGGGEGGSACMYDGIPSAVWGGRSLRRQLQPFISAVFHASRSVFFFSQQFSKKQKQLQKKNLISSSVKSERRSSLSAFGLLSKSQRVLRKQLRQRCLGHTETTRCS